VGFLAGFVWPACKLPPFELGPLVPSMPITTASGVSHWGVRLPEAPQLRGGQVRDPIFLTERVPPQRPLSQAVSLSGITTAEPREDISRRWTWIITSLKVVR
jgi:hypothetical protein